jgi:AmiR/NasT family two-component response regulator
MTALRLVQNFSGNRAILLGGHAASVATLVTALAKLGLTTEAIEPTEEAVMALLPVLQPERDVIIVDGDAENPPAGSLNGTSVVSLVPVVALVGVETPGRLKALMALGATAFIKKPVQHGGVYSALFLGINEHRMRRHQAEIVNGYKQRRQGRRAVVKAILHLISEGLDDDAAYELLRRDAMRARLSIEAYCEAFLQRCSGAREGRRNAS